MLIDAAGKLLAERRVAGSPIEQPRPGWRQQNPNDWLQQLTTVVTALPRELRQAVGSMAIDGTSGTLLLTDAHGQPATAALLYNDARASAQAERIRAMAPTDSAAHGASASLAKWLWLLDEDPGRRELTPLHQAEWVSGWLSGRFESGDYHNALKLGFDPRTRDWPSWLEALQLPVDRLPRLVAPGAPLGPIRAEAARRLGLPRTTCIHAGTTDSIAAFIATGASDSGQAVTSLGSTLVLKILSDRPVFAPEFGIYSHWFGERWLVGGASNSGGAVLKQFFSDEALEQLSRQIEPSESSGLDYYPLPAVGERFPVADPHLAPRLEPMIRSQQPQRFLHGLLEGMANIEQQAWNTLRQLGAPDPTIVFTAGGGAKNPAWLAIRQARIPCPVVVARHTEAAYGAALLARDGFFMTTA